MTHDTEDRRLDLLIKEHYLGKQLSSDKVDSIQEVGKLSREVRTWRRLTIGLAVALSLLACVAVSIFVRVSHLERSLAKAVLEVAPPEFDRVEVAQPMRKVDAGVPTQVDEPQFMLVAFQSHGHGCPNCQATRDAMRLAERGLPSGLVDFQSFDLADPSSIGTRLEDFKLTSLVAGQAETAFLTLATVQGQVVERFDPAVGGQRIATRVQELVAALKQ